MSYILEALRRADAERRRGAVPGLHAPDHGRCPTDREPSGRIGPWALIGAAVVMVLAGASGAWWWAVQRPIADPRASSAKIVTPSASPAPPRVVGAALPCGPELAPASTPAVGRAAAPPWSAGRADDRLGVAGRAGASGAARPAGGGGRLTGWVAGIACAAASSPGAVARANDLARPVASAPPARLPLLAELPKPCAARWPASASTDRPLCRAAAACLVILNGQVFREGESPATDLRIEQIRLRSVVFNLRGQRFEMPM